MKIQEPPLCLIADVKHDSMALKGIYLSMFYFPITKITDHATSQSQTVLSNLHAASLSLTHLHTLAALYRGGSVPVCSSCCTERQINQKEKKDNLVLGTQFNGQTGF